MKTRHAQKISEEIHIPLTYGDETIGWEDWFDTAYSICRFSPTTGTFALGTSGGNILEIMMEVYKTAADLQPDLDISTEEIQNAEQAVSELLCEDMLFFLTDLQSTGVMPNMSLEGEAEVWLISQCSMPVVLEKLESDEFNGEIRYEIVCQALVDQVDIHGQYCNVMNGEAWKTARKEDFQRITIV